MVMNNSLTKGKKFAPFTMYWKLRTWILVDQMVTILIVFLPKNTAKHYN